MSNNLYKVGFVKIIKANGAAEALKLFCDMSSNLFDHRNNIRISDYDPAANKKFRNKNTNKKHKHKRKKKKSAAQLTVTPTQPPVKVDAVSRTDSKHPTADTIGAINV